MSVRFGALLIVVFALVSVGYIQTSAQDLVTCPQVVQRAIEAVGNNCGGLARNSACYGYQSVQAEFSQQMPTNYFSAPSDRAQLVELERLGTSPLDENLNQWGIALLSVQANLPDALPGQNVQFMLLGDSQIEDAVQPGDTSKTPMQAFYFQSGISGTKCTDAPNALVVQGPKGVTVNLRANGADIQLGSTIVLYQVAVDAQTQSNLTNQYGNIGQVSRLLQIGVLDGHVVLDVGTDHAVTLETGETTFRCLSDEQSLGINGQADDREVINNCPWAAPRPLTQDEVEQFRYLQNMSLNYPIQLPLQLPSLNTEQLPFTTQEVVPLPTGTETVEPDITPTPIPMATNAPTSVPQQDQIIVIATGVAGPPQPPVANDDGATTDEDTPATINVIANDLDPNNDPLTVTSVSAPAHGSVVNHGNGTVTYTPDANYHGEDSFTYDVSDGNSGSDTATVNLVITSVDDPPVAVDDCVTTHQDVSVWVDPIANDSDPEGDSIYLSGKTNGAHGTVGYNEGPGLYYNPDPGFSGDDSFTYDVSDGEKTSTGTVCVHVTANLAPVAVDDNASTGENVAVQVDVLANDSDPEGLGIYVSGTTDGAHGTATTDGSYVTYTPNTGYTGTDTITYTITDSSGDTATANVFITINTDSAPVAVDDYTTTSFNTEVWVYVLDNDYDPDGGALTVTNTSDGANGTVTNNGDGWVIYTPNTGFVGTDRFPYTIADPFGSTASAIVVVDVSSNHAPVAVDDDVTTAEDTPITIDVLTNDSDADNDPMTVGDCGDPYGGTIVFNPDNTITYTPYADYYGTDYFYYYLNDGMANSYYCAMVTVHITPVNDAPIVSDDAYITGQDFPVSDNVLYNDYDPDGDSLTTAVNTPPANGTLILNPDGSFTYTPDAGFSGTDSFTYDADDGNGLKTTATVTITVVKDNVPVAFADTYSTPLDTPLAVPAPGVLGNDTDAEGSGITASLVATTTHGSLTLHPDGSFSYTPDTGFNGVDTFTYQASDGVQLSNVATVTLQVGPQGQTVTIIVHPTPIPYPTETPLAPLADYTYLDDMVRSSVPLGLQFTVFGRMIVRNGVLLPGLNYGYIGNQALLDMGVIHAMDIFSTTGEKDFGVGVGICMKGRGRLFFLDANFMPRSPRELDWTYVDGYTCGTILAPGVVVLVQGTRPSTSSSAQTCHLTTVYNINLRRGASMDTESLTIIPPRTSLTATRRAGDWFAVSYNGMAGYVSARYVSVQANCGL